MLNIITQAQVVRQPLSTHYPALGAYSKSFSDVFSGTVNQASLTSLESAAFAAYGERRFMLNELNGFTSIIAIPTQSGTFGFQVDYFGSSVFNESQLGCIYARRISNKVDIGAKFNYHSIRVGSYGSASTVNFEAGAIFHLTDHLHTGIHLYNPGGSKLGKSGAEKLASVYLFGLGYEVSEKLLLSAEIVKQEDRAAAIQAGLQFKPAPFIFLRTGVSTVNNNSYVSVGLNVGFGRIDVSAAYHQQLGFTPGILLLIFFKKNADE